ncbi:unnamed protein product [Adineta steineri]|uniref:Uncharacterized protein n=1 Tax=Adineta steineri TaxID=433720 RepID=A0A814PXS9_9BILA|nr:unnamed protein product [Adineta steineri]
MQPSPIASNNNQYDYGNDIMRPYRIISSNIRDDYQSQDGNNINTMPPYRIIARNNKDNYQNQNINNIDATTTTNIEESENSEDDNQTITMIMTTQPVATKRFTAAKTTMIFSIIVITILLLLILTEIKHGDIASATYQFQVECNQPGEYKVIYQLFRGNTSFEDFGNVPWISSVKLI